MYSQDLSDSNIKRDPWVKAFKRTYIVEDIVELIVKRINSPSMHGPFIKPYQGEEPTDIINAFISKDESVRKKVAPAVGLLLYNLLHERITISHDLLRGTFALIKNSKLDECTMLLWKWLQKNEAAIASDDVKWKTTYREAMYAFAYVQRPNDSEVEKWWHSLWRTTSQFWWGAVFIGLRIQNPNLASTQLEALVKTRGFEKTDYLLAGMWADKRSRMQLETAICVGINEDSGWAGRALNQMWQKLAAEERVELMADMKKVMYG
jgi:hypothetical protein